MHTFFINTAPALFDAEKVKQYMFASLEKSNRLIYFNIHLDELSACALSIHDLISKDVEITDTNFNVIVYVDVDKDNEAAWVHEQIALMAVNENLAAVLHRHGKYAQNIQIVFGEHFDRKDEFWNADEIFKPNAMGILWDALGFPHLTTVQGVINTVTVEHPASKSDAHERVLLLFHTLLKEYEAVSLIGTQTFFFKTVVDKFCEAIGRKIFEGNTIDLQRELYDGFIFIANAQRQRFVQSALTSICLSIDDADQHKLNRSAYRLYLYVYYCAICGSVYAEISEVDWTVFANVSACRREVFKKERQNLQNIEDEFPFLDTSSLGGETVAVSDQKILFEINHEVPMFTVDSKLNLSMSVTTLKAERERLLKEISVKNADNERLLKNFIAQITENFNNGIANTMREHRRNHRRTDKNIDSLDRTEAQAKEWKLDTEGFVAGQQDLRATDVNFREKIDEVKRKTEYYFECIKKGKLIWIVFGIIMLFFIIPYIWTQHTDLVYEYSGSIFGVSMGVVAAAFLVSYLWFIHKYKILIVKTLKDIRNEYNAAQSEKATNAAAYKTRLTHYIPRSTILQAYYEDVLRYKKSSEILKLLKNYHREQLSGFAKYISDLLRMLDIEHRITENPPIDDSTYVYRLSIDLVKSEVSEITELYYILNGESIKGILKDGGAI